MKTLPVLITASALIASCYAATTPVPTASATVRIVDDSGLSITGVIVRVRQARTRMEFDKDGNLKAQYLDVITNTNGEAQLTFPNFDKQAYFRVNNRNNEGYVDGFYLDLGSKLQFTELVDGRWQPWNARVTHVIRPIVNPIPMYARATAGANPYIQMPEFGKPFGFDMIKSDWVKPYGKGDVSDFVIRLDVEDAKVPSDYYTRYPNAIRRKDKMFTVTFSRPDDGIQGFLKPTQADSLFRSPRFAPTDGYSTNLVCIYRSDEGHPYNDMDRLDQNYLFRIRTERDSSGAVTNALYGKIYGPFMFYHDGIKLT